MWRLSFENGGAAAVLCYDVFGGYEITYADDDVELPKKVVHLYVHGEYMNVNKRPPNITANEGCIKELFTSMVSINHVTRLCCQLPSLESLYIDGTEVMVYDFCRMPRGLRALFIESDNVEHVPREIGSLFPELETLSIADGHGINLDGIELPPKLKTFSLSRSRNVSLERMVLPHTLESIDFGHCGQVEGFNTLKFPDGLVKISIERCRIGWISTRHVLPSKLKTVVARYSKGTDCRVFMRSRTWEVVGRDRDYSMYDHQDAITLFIHNDVLPNELLRYVFEYLE